MKLLHALAAAALMSTPGFADVGVVFKEGAPKDIFVLTNVGACDLGAVSITLDLEGSTAGIIFDVTGAGAGVEVFQPFEIVAGKAFVGGVPLVADGDQAITLQLNNLPQGETVSFTVDVDDTGGGREITVTDSEIQGSTATVETASWAVTETFGDNAQASVSYPACT